MNAHLTKVSLALLSTVFLLGCQEQGSGPVGPEGPQFNKPDPVTGLHNHGDDGGGGADNSLKLESGMLLTGLPVFVQDNGKKLTVQNDLLHEITMNFTTAINCTRGEFTSEDDFIRLLAELTVTKLRSKTYIEIDKSGLMAGSNNTTSEGHILIVEREGTFDDESTGHTNVRLGKLQRDDVTVKWISNEGSVDVFEFTGPVVVRARGVGGGGGRRSYRAISCDGDNLVKVTLDRSAAN